jgi:hypothetical protein
MKNTFILALSIVLLAACSRQMPRADQATTQATDSLKLLLEQINQKIDSQQTQLTLIKARLDRQNQKDLGIVCFIGNTRPEIRRYWLLNVDEQYIGEGVYADAELDFLSIRPPVGTGAPYFAASFSPGGSCIEHSQLISADDFGVYIQRFKYLGFEYNKALDGWMNQADTDHVWYMEAYHPNYFVSCATVSYRRKMIGK